MGDEPIKAARVIDPRIAPRKTPAYVVPIAPKQNQYYKVNNSALGNSYIAFNNMTTLGADRAYLDTMEIEITAEINFQGVNRTQMFGDASDPLLNYPNPFAEKKFLMPPAEDWTFDSFPFARCCETVRVNINGNTFDSQPLSYIRAKERYWDQAKLNKAFGTTTPCNKANTANEVAYNAPGPFFAVSDLSAAYFPFRLSTTNNGYGFSANGPDASVNNSVLNSCYFRAGAQPNVAFDNPFNTTFTVTWREPIFCPPLSSRFDEIHGRPLYNITSIDVSMNLQSLTNMIRWKGNCIDTVAVNITNARLCYQVCTLPQGLTRPPATYVPYRRMVPYVTEYVGDAAQNGMVRFTNNKDFTQITMSSGQYTLNEIPTAIWVFCAPSKRCLQQDAADGWKTTYDRYFTEHAQATRDTPAEPARLIPNTTHACNKLAVPIQKLSISMANTTQLLSTAEPLDLYRIAKANGLQDSYASFAKTTLNPTMPIVAKPLKYATGKIPFTPDGGGGASTTDYFKPINGFNELNTQLIVPGAGSYLRLIPGIDLVLPEQDLVPGANANNMVFQVSEAVFNIPNSYPYNYRQFALWILFEYVGVACLTPGQCEIIMNPLGDGQNIADLPIVEAPEPNEPSSVEGSGFWDKVKAFFGKLHKKIRDAKLASTIASSGIVPDKYRALAETAANVYENTGRGVVGAGGPIAKRARGGAVMGLGDFC